MLNKTIKVITNIVLVLLILVGILVAFSLLPIKGNYKLYTVMSGSMEPEISTGGIVLVKPAEDYAVGDVITYEIRGSQDKVTHRIHEISKVNGETVAITKGDANNAPDSDPVYSNQIVGKEYIDIPWLGYILSYIKTPVGLILIIIIPAVIIIYEEIRKIKNEAQEIMRRRRERKNKKKAPKKKEAKNEKNS